MLTALGIFLALVLLQNAQNMTHQQILQQQEHAQRALTQQEQHQYDIQMELVRQQFPVMPVGMLPWGTQPVYVSQYYGPGFPTPVQPPQQTLHPHPPPMGVHPGTGIPGTAVQPPMTSTFSQKNYTIAVGMSTLLLMLVVYQHFTNIWKDHCAVVGGISLSRASMFSLFGDLTSTFHYIFSYTSYALLAGALVWVRIHCHKYVFHVALFVVTCIGLA